MLPKIALRTSNTYIHERPRWKFVLNAAQALIATTNPHLRWLIVQGGQAEFLRVARQKFLSIEPGILFTEDELRWMFQNLETSIPARFREAEMAKEIERFQRKVLTDKDLKGDTLDGDGSVSTHDGPSESRDGITTETLPDREKRLVQ